MDDRSLAGLRRIPGVTAAYVMERGAVPSGQGGDARSEAQSALLSALVSALGQVTDDLDLGDLGETIIEAERGAVVAGSLPGGRAAVVLAEEKANLGMIRVELRKLRRAG